MCFAALSAKTLFVTFLALGGAVMRTLSRAVFLRKPGWERGVFGRWRGTGHAYGGHRVDACIDCAEYAYARLMCGDLGDETDHG